MNKLLATLGLLLFFVFTAVAQATVLLIKGYGKDLYLEHKVAPKEGIFAIGRIYNVHPKFIASYNKIDMGKGLTIGQVLRIPLTDTNFSQANTDGRPVYYRVGDKETLVKISSVNNKVSLQKLRDWNKLRSDNLAAGTNLVVGFLVPGVNSTTAVTTPAKEELKKPEENKQQARKDSVADKTKPLARKDETKKDEGKKDEGKKEEVKKEEVKKDVPKKTEPVAARKDVTREMSGQGYFKASFDQQVKAIPLSKTETVTSGIFNMANPSPEAKYYLLADGIPPGTVVRVINPDNNKAVYAKVLGEMNGIRQNAGLNIRISDIAASALGIAETDKFILRINY
jgi:hypothetical protein